MKSGPGNEPYLFPGRGSGPDPKPARGDLSNKGPLRNSRAEAGKGRLWGFLERNMSVEDVDVSALLYFYNKMKICLC